MEMGMGMGMRAAVAHQPEHERVERFVRELVRVGGTAAVLSGEELGKELGKELATHLLSWLEEREARRVLLAPDPLVEELALGEALAREGLEVLRAEAELGSPRAFREAAAGITGALAAVAESGTLLLGGAPRGGWQWASLLPPLHVAVIPAKRICASLEDAFQALTEAAADGVEEFVWITGPSRTADIAITPLLGMHGPQELHAVILS